MNWFFPRNDGGQFHGIGDSGIDLFKGDPVKSLTREICQNSIDAAVSDGPVKVEFQLFSIETSAIPGYEVLRKYFEMAYDFCKRQKFVKATRYFEKSIPLLDAPKIDVLRISDFNTTGLPGATTAGSDFTTPWFRLVRSVGSSDKADGSIGAFGSGKLASFGCSALQTIFYNTYVEDEGEAYQGVSKLIGFIDKENHLCSDIGYYSEPLSMPVLNQLNIGDGFTRTVPGTDVYILGFKFSQLDWQKELIASVLDGFFYAIKEKHLIVEVGDEKIDDLELPKLIQTYKDYIDERTYDYYRVMASEKTTSRTYSCMEENDVDVSMLVESGYSKRVAIIRYPGMKVFDKGNISATIPFSGICVIKGKKIAKLLGGLENIQHNKWELSRYDDDPDKQAKARKERDKVYRILQDLFKELRGQDSEGEIDPNIGDCLPDPFSETEEKKQALTDEVLEIGKTREIVVIPPTDVDIEDEEGEDTTEGDNQQGTGGGQRIPGLGPGPEPGPKPGQGPGPEPGPNPPVVDGLGAVKNVRSIRANIRFKPIDVNRGIYDISIAPQNDVVDGKIYISIGAETGSYNARVRAASINGESLLTNGSKIEGINIPKGITSLLNVTIDYSDVCSLEVKVYGY